MNVITLAVHSTNHFTDNTDHTDNRRHLLKHTSIATWHGVSLDLLTPVEHAEKWNSIMVYQLVNSVLSWGKPADLEEDEVVEEWEEEEEEEEGGHSHPQPAVVTTIMNNQVQ